MTHPTTHFESEAQYHDFLAEIFEENKPLTYQEIPDLVHDAFHSEELCPYGVLQLDSQSGIPRDELNGIEHEAHQAMEESLTELNRNHTARLAFEALGKKTLAESDLQMDDRPVLKTVDTTLFKVHVNEETVRYLKFDRADVTLATQHAFTEFDYSSVDEVLEDYTLAELGIAYSPLNYLDEVITFSTNSLNKPRLCYHFEPVAVLREHELPKTD